MQQPFPPYNQPMNSGQSAHPDEGSCGCGGSTENNPTGHTAVNPNHDQNQYQYFSEGSYPNYSDGYQLQSTPGALSNWFDFSNQGYLKGFIAGAGITFLLTNPAMKRGIIKGIVGLTSVVQGGVEEVKEQVQDIKAEMSQKE